MIICGAGQVGFNIARYLAGENNDVTVIDTRANLIRQISDALDVQALTGYASHPDVLEMAGAEEVDMLIAVTHVDEVNMVACQVAHSLFGVPTKIARVRHQSYLQPIWAHLFSRDDMPIDVIISPEIEVAQAVTRRLQVPGAIEVIPMAGNRVWLIGVRCTERTPVVHTPLRQLTVLFPNLAIIIVGIVRQEQAVVPTPDDQMLPGDEVYFVVDTAQIQRAMAAFGHEEHAVRRILIFGGGNIGLFLAQQLETEFHEVNAKIIEIDKNRAELVAKALSRTVVLNGDVLDPEILNEASVGQTEAVVAVTNGDETNILSSLLAKRYGCERAITLINKNTYNTLVGTLGVDVAVNPRGITVSKILQHVRRGRIHAVHSLHEGFGELIEAAAMETSSLVGVPLKDARLPPGVIVGAIVRNDEVIMPRRTSIIQAKDRVVLFAAHHAVKQVEKIFSVRLEYF
ncbi:Trk system potassium uptake protein TrkA [invertebrate metagenome]|uniref:Trk system potassium uptake protein TrkA n=1 Tax=invertebrate metagenome TaxID=1711999 RepID=A0A484H5N2_9ZZZZ